MLAVFQTCTGTGIILSLESGFHEERLVGKHRIAMSLFCCLRVDKSRTTTVKVLVLFQVFQEDAYTHRVVPAIAVITANLHKHNGGGGGG